MRVRLVRSGCAGEMRLFAGAINWKRNWTAGERQRERKREYWCSLYNCHAYVRVCTRGGFKVREMGNNEVSALAGARMGSAYMIF